MGIAVVAGSFAALALASTKTINDPRDVKCYQGTRVVSCAKTRPKPADIKTVTAKTGNGKIRFQITSYNAVMHKLSGGINGSPAVQVLMKVGTKNFITGSQDGRTLKIVNLRNGKVTGSVSYQVPNKQTEVMTFSKKAIGSPSRFRWRATDPSCESCGPVNDQAPNKGFVTQHT